jgi:hypothetical protein
VTATAKTSASRLIFLGGAQRDIGLFCPRNVKNRKSIQTPARSFYRQDKSIFVELREEIRDETPPEKVKISGCLRAFKSAQPQKQRK